ncbi:hypothetical protein BpHYR1_015425 [Brachionus plicatilis]|uniref:Uncharacterized protein n=1 Tax=Brachionus plicatilis TaxID=10195 RepID=A0A3M7P5T5_BRAPC|nr:hypothetical protein BpHYR1_015425 [Brachionus plicatilis]
MLKRLYLNRSIFIVLKFHKTRCVNQSLNDIKKNSNVTHFFFYSYLRFYLKNQNLSILNYSAFLKLLDNDIHMNSFN